MDSTLTKLTRPEIKRILQDRVKKYDISVLSQITAKNVSRVHDYYTGFLLCFETFVEQPVQQKDVKSFLEENLTKHFFKIMEE